MKEIPITEEQFTAQWELIKNHVIPSGTEQQFDTDKISDISILEKKRGKYHFKKHHDNKQIRIGDRVKKDNMVATVIDIDGDGLCCGIDGEVVIWKIEEVKLIR